MSFPRTICGEVTFGGDRAECDNSVYLDRLERRLHRLHPARLDRSDDQIVASGGVHSLLSRTNILPHRGHLRVTAGEGCPLRVSYRVDFFASFVAATFVCVLLAVMWLSSDVHPALATAVSTVMWFGMCRGGYVSWQMRLERLLEDVFAAHEDERNNLDHAPDGPL